MLQVPGATELVVLLLVLLVLLAVLVVSVAAIALVVAFLTGAWIFADSDDEA